MSQTAAWLTLFVAGLFEIGWAIGLKYTEGFTRLWPTMWTAIALLVSMALLGVAVGEPASMVRVASIGLILAGIVGLKLATPR